MSDSVASCHSSVYLSEDNFAVGDIPRYPVYPSVVQEQDLDLLENPRLEIHGPSLRERYQRMFPRAPSRHLRLERVLKLGLKLGLALGRTLELMLVLSSDDPRQHHVVQWRQLRQSRAKERGTSSCVFRWGIDRPRHSRECLPHQRWQLGLELPLDSFRCRFHHLVA